MNDDNFKSRYEIFYNQMAPMLDLYLLKPGDILTIKAYTKTGFMESVNVKIYWTYQFKGFEKSNLAGASCLMDLMSFRDLYGYATPEKVAEAKELEKAAGTGFISRNDAESQLFGGTTSAGTAQEKAIDVRETLGSNAKKGADYINRIYSQEEIEKGMVLEAAVFLKDPSRLKQTMKELQQLSDKENLGLKFITGQKAAGILGQLLLVIKFILYFATAIIFLVALIIINSAVVMATLQRVREIGTLRAIGARKTFVISMILTETVLLGLVFGTAGAAIGSSLVAWLGSAGIPAMNDNLYFFFSGPRLFPALDAGSVIGSFLVIILVTCASAMYPALIATKVSPITAITTED
jgi:ABC-type antimicrobial peptide transport system permease subunit